MNQDRRQGIIDRCIQQGIDPDQLVKNAIDRDSRLWDYLFGNPVGAAGLGAVRGGNGDKPTGSDRVIGAGKGFAGSWLGGVAGGLAGGGAGMTLGVLSAMLSHGKVKAFQPRTLAREAAHKARRFGGDFRSPVQREGTAGAILGSSLGGAVGMAEGSHYATGHKKEEGKKKASYYEGFYAKCAQHGIDPKQLAKPEHKPTYADIIRSTAVGGGLGAAAGSGVVGGALALDAGGTGSGIRPRDLGEGLIGLDKAKASGGLKSLGAHLMDAAIPTDPRERELIKLLTRILKNKRAVIGVPAAAGAALLGGSAALRKADNLG